ncbi:hypothetical protein GGR42_000437 [Saonia flava]|uniref:DUF4251 domain-containing protein n=1 Tax=Saonia flava TaxID=523696 RepID=A0A846QWL4_9FLAO|nr:DUF4251 domain-containing protein [Saonia flava]NJB69975.1 hypothetical protein [Saonia flava]
MKNLVVVILIFFGVSSLNAQTEKEKSFEDTKAIIESGLFRFEAITALPTRGSSISLTTNTGHINVNGGRAEVFLPYFGEIRGMGGYGDNGSIEIKNKVVNYQVKYNDRKHRIVVTFNSRNKSERFDFTFTIGSSGKSSVIVKSINRTTINYYGTIYPLTDNEKTK